MVEVHPDTGQASPPAYMDSNIRSADSILHRRHLAKRKHKRRKKHHVSNVSRLWFNVLFIATIYNRTHKITYLVRFSPSKHCGFVRKGVQY